MVIIHNTYFLENYRFTGFFKCKLNNRWSQLLLWAEFRLKLLKNSAPVCSSDKIPIREVENYLRKKKQNVIEGAVRTSLPEKHTAVEFLKNLKTFWFLRSEFFQEFSLSFTWQKSFQSHRSSLVSPYMSNFRPKHITECRRRIMWICNNKRFVHVPKIIQSNGSTKPIRSHILA